MGKLSATGLKVEEAKNKVKRKAKASVDDVREAVLHVRDDVKQAVILASYVFLHLMRLSRYLHVSSADRMVEMLMSM